MNSTKIARTMISLLIGAAFLPLSQAASPDQGGSITQAEISTPMTAFPTDLVRPANQTQLANYAWRLFIAATQQTTASLMSGAGRAVGDGTHSFKDTGATPAVDNPLVFESFYHRTEAFPHYLNGAVPPSPINQLPVYNTFFRVPDGASPVASPACPLNTTRPRISCSFTGQNYVNLDETNQIGQNFLYYKNSNAPDFPVLFMAKVNTLETQYALGWTGTKPSNSNSFAFPTGVVEVKTAWRRVQDIKGGDQGKYHLAQATYYVADASGLPVPHTATVALIGIHIIQKTTNYPQFIFTTFEHVDAVTRNSSNVITDPAYTVTYNNVSYQSPDVAPHTATANGAYYINRAGQPPQPNKLSTYPLPPKGQIPDAQLTKVVVQPGTILREVNDVNNQVNALVKGLSPNNVWANYRLKGVQAVPTSDNTTGNYYLANIVVESSRPGIQLFSGILLNGGVGNQGTGANSANSYFVNCRGDKGNSTCEYPVPVVSPVTPPGTYNNVSPSAQQNQAVPAPVASMGGCQGCHGAAQQAGQDFSFLASGVLGAGKSIDTVPASSLSAAQKAAHKKAMAQSKF